MRARQTKVMELLDTSGRHLHALLGRLTLSEQAVGDLMQELFIKLSRSKGFARARDPFAYAHRAAVNLAFEWHRRQKTRFVRLDEDCLTPQHRPSALQMMIQQEQLQQVLDATSKLGKLARDVVVMRHIEQESYEDIARRLGKKPQHIRSVVAKALAEIRQRLATEGSLAGRKESRYGPSG